MNYTMTYKGYNGSVEYSDEDNVYFGKIVGINDRITYEGVDTISLREDFETAIEDYLDLCMQIGKEPEKSHMSEAIVL